MFKKINIYFCLISFALITLIALIFVPNRDSGKVAPSSPPPIELKVLTPQPYRINTQTYRDRNTKITFPQLNNFGNRSKQKTINLLIRNEALRVRHFYSDAKQDYNLDIAYEIKLKNPKYLSIQYSGVGYAQGAAYPRNWFYTTNIDLNTGRRLRLKDLVKIDTGLAVKLKSNQSNALRPEQQNILATLSTTELMQRLRAADPPNWNGGAATFSYMTEGTLGISFSVIHALGDHAEFEVKNPRFSAFQKALRGIVLLDHRAVSPAGLLGID